jgi:hypothetical protein
LPFDDIIVTCHFFTLAVDTQLFNTCLNDLIHDVLEDLREVCSFHAAIFNLLESLTIQAELLSNVAVGFLDNVSGEGFQGGGEGHESEAVEGPLPSVGINIQEPGGHLPDLVPLGQVAHSIAAGEVAVLYVRLQAVQSSGTTIRLCLSGEALSVGVLVSDPLAT